jgi:hypothetical protein
MFDNSDTISGSIWGIQDIRFLRKIIDNSCLPAGLWADDKNFKFSEVIHFELIIKFK